MNRRDALIRLSAVAGLTVSMPSLGLLLQGCRSNDPFIPKVLTPDLVAILETVTETILPRTDTPGATDAEVVPFIDNVLDELFDQEKQSAFIADVVSLNDRAAAEKGADLLSLEFEPLFSFLSMVDEEAVEARLNNEDPLPVFATIKELTIVGFYTSRIGLHEEMEYSAAQGIYDECLSLEELGRRWV